MASFRLADIVGALGGELIGDADLEVDAIAPIDTAVAGSISFIAQAKFQDRFAGSAATCVIVGEPLREQAASLGIPDRAAIVTPHPYHYYARLSQWWAGRTRKPAVAGVAASAIVEPGAQIHPSASVGPLAYIGEGAHIGEGVVIGAQAHVGALAWVGARTHVHPRAIIGQACHIGERCIVHSGVVIGEDGFGFAPHEGQWEKIEQLGSVRIGHDVDIGANTCIDRGAIGDTVIGDGVKLDNLIQIAHNVQVGEHTAMAAFVGIAGSARIGAHCMLGGACRIYGHIQIVDHVFVDTCAVISRSILKPGHYSGYFPFDDNATWEKNAATLRHLYALRERLRALEKRIA